MDRIRRFLNGNEEIKKAIPLYIEAFVKFYGEEKRKEIEEKFNNLLCLGYQNPSAIVIALITLENQKTIELLEPIFESINIPLDLITGSLTLSEKDYMPISHLYELIDLHNIGEEGRKQLFYDDAFRILNSRLNMTEEEFKQLITTKEIPQRYQDKSDFVKEYIMNVIDTSKIERQYKYKFSLAKDLLKAIIPSINEDNFEELLNNDIVQKLMNTRENLEEAYKEYKEELGSLQDEAQNIKELSTKLGNNLYRQFLKENIDIFPENIRVKVEEYLNDETAILEHDIWEIAGISLEHDGCIKAFSEDAENILHDSNSPSWKVNSIKEERIKYFKILGLDLGDNYDDYLKSEEARKLTPSKEGIERFIKSKSYYLNKYNNMFYPSLERHKKLLAEVEKIDFMDKEDPVNAMTYIEGISYISSNFIRGEEGYISYPILIINFSNFNTDSLDHTIVHELNHVFESCIGLVGEDEYEFISGWDLTTSKLNLLPGQEVNTLENRENRSYELFNEIINELIAKKISQIMHEENMYVFDDENNSKYEYTTGYDYSRFLVEDFFNEFKDAIIKSRSNGNIEIIFDEVGKDNFDALNELFHIYNDAFSSISEKVKLYSSVQKGEETELTRIYYKLVEKRNQILENMRKYRANKNAEVKGVTI